MMALSWYSSLDVSGNLLLVRSNLNDQYKDGQLGVSIKRRRTFTNAFVFSPFLIPDPLPMRLGTTFRPVPVDQVMLLDPGR